MRPTVAGAEETYLRANPMTLNGLKAGMGKSQAEEEAKAVECGYFPQNVFCES